MSAAPPEVVEPLTSAGLAALLIKHPDYRVVSDVGASMFSGWGDLRSANVYHDTKVIELEFS